VRDTGIKYHGQVFFMRSRPKRQFGDGNCAHFPFDKGDRPDLEINPKRLDGGEDVSVVFDGQNIRCEIIDQSERVPENMILIPKREVFFDGEMVREDRPESPITDRDGLSIAANVAVVAGLLGVINLAARASQPSRRRSRGDEPVGHGTCTTNRRGPARRAASDWNNKSAFPPRRASFCWAETWPPRAFFDKATREILIAFIHRE
jgi:hypothetical protein